MGEGKWNKVLFVFESGNVVPITKSPTTKFKRKSSGGYHVVRVIDNKEVIVADLDRVEQVIWDLQEWEDNVAYTTSETLGSGDRKAIERSFAIFARYIHLYGGVTSMAKKFQDLLAEKWEETDPNKTKGGLRRALETNKKVAKKRAAQKKGDDDGEETRG